MIAKCSLKADLFLFTARNYLHFHVFLRCWYISITFSPFNEIIDICPQGTNNNMGLLLLNAKINTVVAYIERNYKYKDKSKSEENLSFKR
jgi:hypothetical protein